MRLCIALCAFLAFSASAADLHVPEKCAGDLAKQHPDWKLYAPDVDYAKKNKHYRAVTLASGDFDSDGKPDVAFLATFQSPFGKGVGVFACLSSRANALSEVSHIATGDSQFAVEAVDNSRQNMDGIRSRAEQPPKTGILWRHNSYGGMEYWYVNGTFVEGDFYGED